MNKISEYYQNSKRTFILMIISIIFSALIILFVQEVNDITVLSVIYSLLSILLVCLNNKFKGNKFLDIIIGIFYMPLIFVVLLIPSLFLMFMLGIFMAINPEKNVRRYEYSYKLDYFPRELPSDYEDAGYYRAYGFLQAGDVQILYLKTDEEFIQEYKNRFEDSNIKRNNEMGYNVTYFNTPYEDKTMEGFDWYIIESKCDDSGYCNHGIDKHIRINEETKEIIFYYYDW